ncbi:MAG: hypothetical protein KF819_26790 [Labilithrix sp.]|nr:hypothetical protein [Labilithrix sp.]
MGDVYQSSAKAARLYQGEVLSNVIERSAPWIRAEGDEGEFGLDEVVHPYAVIISQDCDLEQDARARSTPMDPAKRENATLRYVLIVVASEFEKATGFGGSDIKRRAKQNKDERFQFLAPVPAEDDALTVGVVPLVLDFKRFFSYRTDELLKAIERAETKRRTRLLSPYVEHLSDRFAFFFQRIGLPRDHHDIADGRGQPSTAGASATPKPGDGDAGTAKSPGTTIPAQTIRPTTTPGAPASPETPATTASAMGGVPESPRQDGDKDAPGS